MHGDRNGFYFTITTKAGSATRWIEGNQLDVGKSGDCQVSIHDEALNPKHMSVNLKQGEVWIEDLGSSNGTFINGKRLQSHTPFRVSSEDRIQLAKGDLQLQVTPTVNEEDASPSDDLMQAARVEAARIIEESEVEAEQRVQEIYRKAMALQAQTEQTYHDKLNAAYRDANVVVHEAQAEGHQLLSRARLKSSEIRAQAEGFISELRAKTQSECEGLLDQAQLTARELKEKSLSEADRILREKEQQLLEHSRATLKERLARFDEELEQEEARRRAVLDDELSEIKKTFSKEMSGVEKELQHAREDLKVLIEKRAFEQSLMSEMGQKIEARRVESEQSRADIESLKKQASSEAARANELKEQVKFLDGQRQKLDLQNRETESKFERMQQELATSTLRLREKLDAEKVRLATAEEQHREKLEQETTLRIRGLEQKMISRLRERRERMAREMALMTETFVKQGGESINLNYADLRDRLSRWFDGEIGVMIDAQANDAKADSKTGSVKRLVLASALVGVVIGGALGWSVKEESNLNRAVASTSPMDRKVAAAAAVKKADLEIRKFDPVQTLEYRGTYVDNVLYQKGYTDRYLSDEFQRRYLRRLAPYLLKTWRVDEAKAIGAMAISSALIKALIEKRQAIHPDFVDKGIDQMRKVEAGSMEKLRKLLGSKVRVESYLKFEKQYYFKYVDWKASGG